MSNTLLAFALSFMVPSLVHAAPGGDHTPYRTQVKQASISASYTHRLAMKALKDNQGPTKRTLGTKTVDGRYTVFKVEPKRAGETDQITVDTHVLVKGERGERGTGRARFQRIGSL